MIRFENPQFLFLFVLFIPWLAINIFQFSKTKTAIKGFDALKESIQKFKIRTIFFGFSFLFVILGISKPLWGSRIVFEKRRGSSIMFLVDVSKSMGVSDIKPNRLEVAKAYGKLLLNELNNASCGLVLAKGEGVQAVPETVDKQILESALNSLTVNSLSSAGTNLESGIIKAAKSFSSTLATSKTIVVFTDGDETKGDISKSISVLKNKKIKLVIIGFGTSVGEYIFVYDKNNIKRKINTNLKEDKLRQAIKPLDKDALYVKFDNPSSLTKIIEIIDLKDNSIETIEKIQKPAERSFEMTLLAMIFLCCGFVFGGKRW
ncbi:MAG: aerotolerance regulator BatB [Treponema sp.]|nr:MAG: aerotolerance regulator BatB [Treponema sp.]